MTTTDQLPHLIKMANQIAVNQPVDILGEEAAVAAVAGHIQKFWAPPMREKIVAYQKEGGAELCAVAARAIATM
ncbi:MAG: formate dehydrogenase subunit delta [Porticoccaceae bacterium]|nr:formate dehydrogenase subunit delta [Porticoccaceae bacterium]